jgi:hypothetical protein
VKGREHLEDSGTDRRTILKKDLGELGWAVVAGYVWLRIRTSGRLL